MAPELAVVPGSFPAAPPADLDSPELITEHDWQAFAAIDRMTDHWDRPGWYPGRRAYYWMLTFADAPELHALVKRCHKELDHLGLDLVPADGLHVTLARIADRSHASPQAIEDLAHRARGLIVDPLHVQAHPLAGSRGALRLSLTPWTPLIELHATLTKLTTEAGFTGSKPTAGFRPHLGIAYNNHDRPAAPVIDAASALRSLPPVPLNVTSVELVELRREGRSYRWTLVHSVRR